MREKRKSTEKKEENLSKADTADVMTKTNTHVILVANVSETELIRQRSFLYNSSIGNSKKEG